jgi:hypothetical protein
VTTTLDLDFTITTTLDPRITFSRTSLATYFDSAGVMKYARHNLALQSQTFDNASWTKASGATVTADATTAPDATTTADRLNHVTAGTVVGGAVTQGPFSAGLSIVSVYAKAGSKNFIRLGHSTTSIAANNCYFNLGTGVVGTKGSAWSSSGIENAGGGWYRCWASISLSSSIAIIVAEADNNLNCTSPGDIFIWGAQVEQVTTETTPRTYLPTTTAAVHNSPRFDFDPVTHAPLGLLIEWSAQNFIAPSQDFTGSTKVGATVTADQTTALDGTTTADLITATASPATISLGHSATLSTANTQSVFLKKGTSDWVYLVASVSTGADVPKAWFNLATGTAGTVESPITASGIVNYGNGWYRCWVQRVNASSGTRALLIGLSDADNSVTVTVGRTVYAWGAQCETQSASCNLASSYVPTVGSAVTRAADIAVMTGTNFSSWFTQPQGTFVAEFDLLSTSGTRGILAADVNDAVSIPLYCFNATAKARVLNSGTQADFVVGALAVATTYKLAMSYAANDFAACLNGGTVSTDTSGTLPTPTQLRIGVESSITTSYLNGHIRRIQFMNVAVDDATLQTLPQPPTGTPIEPVGPSIQGTGGAALWDQFDGREYESSRKRRKRFLEERLERIARL